MQIILFKILNILVYLVIVAKFLPKDVKSFLREEYS